MLLTYDRGREEQWRGGEEERRNEEARRNGEVRRSGEPEVRREKKYTLTYS